MTAGHMNAQDDLAEEQEVPDADALERRRVRDAEEWRLKQLRAGVSAEDNSNFQACICSLCLRTGSTDSLLTCVGDGLIMS